MHVKKFADPPSGSLAPVAAGETDLDAVADRSRPAAVDMGDINPVFTQKKRCNPPVVVHAVAPEDEMSSAAVASRETDLDSPVDLSGAAVALGEAPNVLNHEEVLQKEIKLQSKDLEAMKQNEKDLALKQPELTRRERAMKQDEKDLALKQPELTRRERDAKMGFNFITDYYGMLARLPESLNVLYEKKCDVSWSFNQDSSQLTMKSLEEIKEFLKDNTNNSFCLQGHVLHDSKHVVHVVCNGIFKDDRRRNKFIQSFVVHRKRGLILSDVLNVIPDSPKIILKTGLTREAASTVSKDDPREEAQHSEVMIIYNKACLQHENA